MSKRSIIRFIRDLVELMMMLGDADPAKILLPYVHRAEELQKYEPIVAYHCKLYARNRVLKIPAKERTKATDLFVVSLIEQVEKDKESVLLSSDDGRYVKDFATKLFMKADKQEIRGKPNLNTAKTFYAASLFFEILHNFGDLPFDLEQKQKYAAWRAVEIRKALKNVQRPSRGHPAGDKASLVSDGEVFNHESPRETVSVSSLEPSFSSEQLPTVGLEVDAEQDWSLNSTNQSSVRQRGPSFIPDTQIGGAVSATSNCNRQDSSDDDQYFYDCSEEPDDDELFSNAIGLDQTIGAPANVQGHVYHSSAGEIADNDLRFSSNTAGVLDRTISISAGVHGQHNRRSAADIAGRDHAPNGLDRTMSAPADYRPLAKEIVKALKASRLAVSALAFDDIPSAVSNLRQALDLLTNPPQTQ